MKLKKILQYALPFVAAAGMAGCTISLNGDRTVSLGNGYRSLRGDNVLMRKFAGIDRGSIEVIRTHKGYTTIGRYGISEDPDQKFLNKVCREADKNGDRILTCEEVGEYEKKRKRELFNMKVGQRKCQMIEDLSSR
jgi:hypothetical protein